MAQDLTAAAIPPGLSSPRESVAALQTLLYEAGFEFTNLVPEWFKTRASKIHRSKVYKVVADLLQLLGVEMLEWQQVTAKASGKSVLPEGVKSERPPRLDYHAEDAEGDLCMNDYESDLLGREFVMRFRTLGIRTTRSPRGSSQSEPDAKRPQAHQPQPPSLSSLLLYASSGTRPSTVPPSEVNSVAQMSVSRKTESNSVPSQLDVSGQSSVSQRSFVTGSLSSRDESSGSSMWSYEGGHMPYVGYHPMVMTAHGASGFMPSGPEMGMYVQQTIIPPVQESKPDVGDVDMSESERDAKTVRTSQRRTRRKDRRPDTSSDEESSDDSYYSRRRGRGRRRSSKRTSGRRRSTSQHSERSNRPGYSVKSTGSTQAAMEFMQKMAVSMARVEEKVTQVQEQSVRVEKENVLPRTSPNSASFAPMSPEVVEALRAEGALNERQRVEATLVGFQAQLESEKNRQALEFAEEKARLESEGRRQALELESTRKELLALREAGERDREAALNVQKYYASQLRERRAATTQSNPRDEVPMTPQVPAQAAQTTADGHFAAQLQTTLRNLQQAKVKNDAASRSRSATQVKTEQSSEKRGPPGRTPPGGSDPPKKDAGKSGSSRRGSARRISKRGNDPHDSDPDSDSDKMDDESSDDSDSSFFEESIPDVMTSKTSQAGTTVFTYKPYVNASALEDFNEKASLSTRIRWLEKFQSMAVQGGWSDKMRIYEMKLKLPSSARDWRYNLDEDGRHSWKRFLKAFKEKYCKAKTSDSERYYSMTQKKTEAPLEFFNRLNRVADKEQLTLSRQIGPKRHVWLPSQQLRRRSRSNAPKWIVLYCYHPSGLTGLLRSITANPCTLNHLPFQKLQI
ncbi:hypothetical protein PF005_g29091 [Phytophthora fragariae]|uniref:Retrotransposon gag domain-containing protein n=1 Tax=Phytophthora fragariae TaxID=53985 RepID=A0A6A3VSP8_9STRA|nr:hypothetical protein PF003_g40237 [Phytophthora fragariae]KAE8920394.1 hypothetical protein PF009_g29310 [Phytophthora fragariae]KAE9065548.1 hypothetical protein PF010_g28151 [Phytophthora fragariae]KAE9072853.1 hypothetical protein PF007_g26024 [Phytophthora fragariae]KAE9075133.1 hypothetical protein PF006_g28391 [Phytophthora fragariae]